MADLRESLAAYVAELRERARETTGGSAGLVTWQIADEIEERFLKPEPEKRRDRCEY